MGAILKCISVHSDAGVANVLDYGKDEKKTSLEENGLEALLSYASNSEKTTLAMPKDGEKSMLVSGVMCDPATAEMDFAILRNKYRENFDEKEVSFDFPDKKTGEAKSVTKKPLTAIHIIQSFEEPDLDPRVVNQIGVELLNRLGVQGCVDTHMNTDHLHNHIIVNAYMPDGCSKFCLNKTKILELRKFSDDIQREFGLEINFLSPDQQLRKSKSRSMSYNEWQAKGRGESWKDTVRRHIKLCRDSSDTKEDFISLMASYGYTAIPKENGSITWDLEYVDKKGTTHHKRINDITLGDEYSAQHLFGEKPIIVEEDRVDKNSPRLKVISTARYSFNGHRRSDLEMLIRAAIATIQRIINYFKDKAGSKKIETAYISKLTMLEEALKTLKEYDITSFKELDDKLDLAGKNLNYVKSGVSGLQAELKFYAEAEKMIEEYNAAKKAATNIIKNHNLYLNRYSASDIALKTAAICPMSPRQKAELFMLMESRPNLRILDAGKGYANVSAVQFGEIKDFFKGKIPCPVYLVDVEKTSADHSYQRQYENLKERLNLYEPNRTQRESAAKLLVEHGFSIDPQSLSLADVINIENCYGKCPLSGEFISKEQKENLDKLLEKTGNKIGRDTKYILTTEYDGLCKFLTGKSHKIPQLLRESTISDKDIARCQSLLIKSGISISMPFEALAPSDIRTLYGFLVSQGREPMCVLETSDARQTYNVDLFHHDIEKESPRAQQILIALRNSINDLASIGIKEEDIPAVLEQITEKRDKLSELTTVQNDFSGEYKELLRLKQQTKYAGDKHFLFGTLFDEKELKNIENKSVEKDEKDTEREEEPAKKKHRILDTDFDL